MAGRWSRLVASRSVAMLRSFSTRGAGRRPLGAASRLFVSGGVAAGAAGVASLLVFAEEKVPAPPAVIEQKAHVPASEVSEPATPAPAGPAEPSKGDSKQEGQEAGGDVGGKDAAAVVETESKEKDPNAIVDISKLQVYDRNWDGRAPKEGEPKPKASRFLILVRHGHYLDTKKTDAERILTSTGRQQARVVARRIADMPWEVSKVIVSDMARAQETFDIIMQSLPEETPTTVMPGLREGRPCQPIPASRSGLYKQSTVDRDGLRIDEAYRDLFHRASPDQEKDSHEVVVCHANVIRYYVCKALQVPTEAWLRIGLPHCSYTVIEIKPSGLVSVRGMGDTHYLPPHLVTYS